MTLCGLNAQADGGMLPSHPGRRAVPVRQRGGRRRVVEDGGRAAARPRGQTFGGERRRPCPLPPSSRKEWRKTVALRFLQLPPYRKELGESAFVTKSRGARDSAAAAEPRGAEE